MADKDKDKQNIKALKLIKTWHIEMDGTESEKTSVLACLIHAMDKTQIYEALCHLPTSDIIKLSIQIHHRQYVLLRKDT